MKKKSKVLAADEPQEAKDLWVKEIQQIYHVMDKQKPQLGLNPSFCKPFGAHTFYQGEGRPDPLLSQNLMPYKLEILLGTIDIFECLRNVKAVYIVFTWLL